MKFVSKNAYIQIALTNHPFCKSAWNGFALIVKHLHRFGAARSIGSIYMFFGSFMIMSANAALGYSILTLTNVIEVKSVIPAVVVIAILSVMIAYTFLSIFSFSADAIL